MLCCIIYMDVDILGGSPATAAVSLSVLLMVERIICSTTATNSSPETADVAAKSTTKAEDGRMPRRARRFLQKGKGGLYLLDFCLGFTS